MTELESKLAMLRRQGVKTFKGHSIVPETGQPYDFVDVEFFPETPTIAPTVPAKDEDACRCGHKSYEHAPLCLHGCDPLTCSPEEK